jgi:hypothetical protein
MRSLRASPPYGLGAVGAQLKPTNRVTTNGRQNGLIATPSLLRPPSSRAVPEPRQPLRPRPSLLSIHPSRHPPSRVRLLAIFQLRTQATKPVQNAGDRRLRTREQRQTATDCTLPLRDANLRTRHTETVRPTIPKANHSQYGGFRAFAAFGTAEPGALWM